MQYREAAILGGILAHSNMGFGMPEKHKIERAFSFGVSNPEAAAEHLMFERMETGEGQNAIFEETTAWFNRFRQMTIDEAAESWPDHVTLFREVTGDFGFNQLFNIVDNNNGGHRGRVSARDREEALNTWWRSPKRRPGYYLALTDDEWDKRKQEDANAV